MFDCAGSLFWQLNDCWPCISWAVIDYDLNPKAGWYYAKRAYAPVALSLKVEGEAATLYAVNDRSEDVPVTAEVITAHTSTGPIADRSVPGVAAANASTVLGEFSLGELGISDPTRQCVVLRDAGAKAPEHMMFVAEMKDVILEPVGLGLEVETLDDGAHITVTSDGLAHFVAIGTETRGTVLSDNYFSLLPGQRRTVVARARGPLGAEMVSVRCLNNVRG
jgi:beta-mannosidase